MAGDYSTQELMIIAAAREIRDHEVVFVGMRLPITAYAVARLTHAPNAVGLFESGVVRYAPAREMLYSMGDPANQEGAAWTTGMLQVMGLLQAGRVDAGFIGGAEIDRFGNINTSYIGPTEAPKVKLPGSGGAPDIASCAKRLLAIMSHKPRRLVERVGYVTSPGWLDGGDSRSRAGLVHDGVVRGGTAAVITDLAILRPLGPEHELHLCSVHPGVEPETVRERTGWALKFAPEVAQTPPPTTEELKALHQVDPDGYWSGL
jgi:glutaconate CoA-transferase subunit B